MTLRMLRSFMLIPVLVLFIVAPLSAQTNPNTDQGMKPYDSFHGGNIDSVSMTSGNLFVHQPLYSLSQRGRVGFTLSMLYNNKGFHLGSTCVNGKCTYKWTWQGTGVQVGNDEDPLFGLQITSQRVDTGSQDGLGDEVFVTTYSAKTADGYVHQLADTGNGYRAIDASGILWNNSANTVEDRSGMYSGGAKDPNGNFVSLNTNTWTWTDTLNRAIPWAQPGSPSTASTSSCAQLNLIYQPVTYAYLINLPGPTGTSPFIFCYASVYVRSSFFGSAPMTGPTFTDASMSTTMLQSVVLPDGTAWTFQYDGANPSDGTSIGYGDLLRIGFPTGGSISYTYATEQPYQGQYQPDLPTSMSRSVVTRTVDANDGTGRHTWNYRWTTAVLQNTLSAYLVENTVTDPLNNDVVHQITGLYGGPALYETQTRYYQGSSSSGTLLKTVNTDYSSSTNPFDNLSQSSQNPPTATSAVPIRVTTVWPNGQSSKTEMDYDSGFTFRDPTWGAPIYPPESRTSATYPATLGSVTAKREFDFGGTLIRQTLTKYQWQVDSRYLTANLLELPAVVKVLDGSGNLCAETDYFYDQVSPTTPSPAITVQHGAAPGAVRGNLTSVTHKLSPTPCQANATWTSITSQTAWFDTGEVQSSTDPLNHTTTHIYDPIYYGAYPTQTCSPQTGTVTHCVEGAYDSNSGLLTSFTDFNSQVSNYFYDVMWRLTKAQFPLGAETDFSYPNPTSVQRNKKQDASNSIVDSASFDGLGRTKQTQLVDPEGNDFVDTAYDTLGRVSTVSNTHRSVSSSTDGITTTYYDALGRVVQVAPPDGTLVPAGTPVTQCQSNNVCTDYSNFPTVTVTDQTGKQKRTRTDGLGRLVEVDEPGTGTNGPGSSGSGSISISGTLQSSTSSGTKATGSFTISGVEGGPIQTWICNDTCVKGPIVYDSGSVSVTVNGFTSTTTYGRTSTAASIANALATGFNVSGSPVTAACCGSGSTVTLTAAQAGPNYAMSTTASTNDPTDFGGPSFTATLSGAAMTGGVYPVTTYDSGTITVMVNGFQASASYNQNTNSTASALATALASALNASGSPVTASASGTTISLTARSLGTSTDYSVTSSGPTTSFTVSNTTLAGGTYPGGLYAPFVTTYSYDTLGNLTRVNQAGDGSQAARVRTFTYDSLSRLLTATNPESGTITYTYDNDGNMVTKTDARRITINYSPSDATIDGLHRVLKKTYSNGDTPVTYTYDQGANANGRLTSSAVGIINRSLSYDALGRVVGQTDCLPSGCKTTTVPNNGYNLASELVSLNYPDGRNVTSAFSTAGRITSVNLAAFNGTAVNLNYYTVPQTTSPSTWGYMPPGSMTRGNYGNGLAETLGFNPRLQINSIVDVKSTTTLFSKSYGYYDAANHNNGNILSITDGLSSAKNQTYTYDQLNRLATAAESDNAFNVTYSIDPWGNMKESGTSNLTVAFDTSNRMSGWSYDAAGNLLNDGAHSYAYDAECRIKTVDGTGATYTYGPGGERVRKDTATSGSTEYIYFGGGVISELNPSTGAWTDYIFASGKRIAKDTSNNGSGAQYYQGDHLGSARLMTDASGTVISSCSLAPFGEQVSCSPDNASNRYRFTGKERDAESGIDYFGARHYSSSMGRFMTADWTDGPATVPFAHFDNPQSLNLYAYVDNNPVNAVDATGHSRAQEYIVDPVGSWGLDSMIEDNAGNTTASGGIVSDITVTWDRSTNSVITIDWQNGTASVQPGDSGDSAKYQGAVSATADGQTVAYKYMDGRTEYVSGSGHPLRDNNPGDIVYGPFAKAVGAIGDDGRFAIFSTPAAGFAALDSLLTTPAYQRLTVDQAIARFAPSFENNTAAYQASVRKGAGVAGAARVSTLSSRQLTNLEHTIASVEGFYSSRVSTVVELPQLPDRIQK